MNEDASEIILYMEKYGEHGDTLDSKAVMAAITYQIWKLMANSTDFIQLLDLLLISKMRDGWRVAWGRGP